MYCEPIIELLIARKGFKALGWKTSGFASVSLEKFNEIVSIIILYHNKIYHCLLVGICILLNF